MPASQFQAPAVSVVPGGITVKGQAHTVVIQELFQRYRPEIVVTLQKTRLQFNVINN